LLCQSSVLPIPMRLHDRGRCRCRCRCRNAALIPLLLIWDVYSGSYKQFDVCSIAACAARSPVRRKQKRIPLVQLPDRPPSLGGPGNFFGVTRNTERILSLMLRQIRALLTKLPDDGALASALISLCATRSMGAIGSRGLAAPRL